MFLLSYYFLFSSKCFFLLNVPPPKKKPLRSKTAPGLRSGQKYFLPIICLNFSNNNNKKKHAFSPNPTLCRGRSFFGMSVERRKKARVPCLSGSSFRKKPPKNLTKSMKSSILNSSQVKRHVEFKSNHHCSEKENIRHLNPHNKVKNTP